MDALSWVTIGGDHMSQRVVPWAIAGLLFAAVHGPAHAAGRITATEILRIESAALPVKAEEFALLRSIVDEARRSLPRKIDTQDKAAALATLKTIDAILVRRGFIYDGPGDVDNLHDTLAPKVLNAAEYRTALNSSHNTRRHALMEVDPQRQFYVSDCDTASFIYLELADALDLPIRLVEAPRHNFVRWEFEDGTHLNFETMDGEAKSDEAYTAGWGIPETTIRPGFHMVSFTDDEVRGYVIRMRGQTFGELGNFARTKADANTAMRLNPRSPGPLNALAWVLATCAPASCRDGASAVELATRAVAQWKHHNYIDTLACAYAAAGDFKRAEATELEALDLSYKSDYVTNLEAIRAGRTCAY